MALGRSQKATATTLGPHNYHQDPGMRQPTPPHHQSCPESQGPVPVPATRGNLPSPPQPRSSLPHSVDHRPLYQYHPQYKTTSKKKQILWPKVQAPTSSQSRGKLRSHTVTYWQQLFQGKERAHGSVSYFFIKSVLPSSDCHESWGPISCNRANSLSGET